MKRITGLGLALCLCLTASISLWSGCAGDRYERSTGEYIDDKATTSRVKEALGKNEQYKLGDVEVTTFRGSVQLAGFVNSDDQKKKAESIAKEIKGVKEVINNITVKKT